MADYETATFSEMYAGHTRDIASIAGLAEAFFRSHPGRKTVSTAELLGAPEPQPVRKVYSNRNREAHRALQELEAQARRAELARLDRVIARDEAAPRRQGHNAWARERLRMASGGGVR